MEFITSFIKYNYPKKQLLLQSLLDCNKIALQKYGYTIEEFYDYTKKVKNIIIRW
jgi:hypothetical protein